MILKFDSANLQHVVMLLVTKWRFDFGTTLPINHRLISVFTWLWIWGCQLPQQRISYTVSRVSQILLNGKDMTTWTKVHTSSHNLKSVNIEKDQNDIIKQGSQWPINAGGEGPLLTMPEIVEPTKNYSI